jgi:hypothetical protein
MGKKIMALLVLCFMAGAAFAQNPTKTNSPELNFPQPHLTYKADKNKFNPTSVPLQKNPEQLLADITSTAEEEATPFYSNMPVAKVRARTGDLPVAKADSSVHFHLLQKRIKVLPIPTAKTSASPALE